MVSENRKSVRICKRLLPSCLDVAVSFVDSSHAVDKDWVRTNRFRPAWPQMLPLEVKHQYVFRHKMVTHVGNCTAYRSTRLYMLHVLDTSLCCNTCVGGRLHPKDHHNHVHWSPPCLTTSLANLVHLVGSAWRDLCGKSFLYNQT